MAVQFLTFQTFSDIELANVLTEKLANNNIEFRIEKILPLLDSAILGQSSLPEIAVKLHPDEFLKAHKVLEEYYKMQIEAVEKDYYLFDFTNDELFEIITKPDEWGPLDYQLAQKILIDRGQKINEEVTEKLKTIRIQELAKPGKASNSLIVLGYCFFIFAGIVTILTGRYLVNDKKTLPDGQLVFSFSENDRRQGKRMIKIGGVYLIFCVITLIIWLLFSPKE